MECVIIQASSGMAWLTSCTASVYRMTTEEALHEDHCAPKPAACMRVFAVPDIKRVGKRRG